MRIFINPGHGGDDCGAVGHGLNERDTVLRIGKRVDGYLRAVGYQVKLFQYDGLQAICDDANAFDADLFVSIHCNAATSTSAQGTETFCYYGAGKGNKLAQTIQKQLVSSLDVTDRGVKEAGFYVLAHTNMPSVLVETAFITNEHDAKLLTDYEDEFARAIARGITDYFAFDKPMPDTVVTSQGNADKLSAHFDIGEFTCHCCGGGASLISDRLIELLEQLRVKAGKPIHVNCGYRCPPHNAAVGGVPNSQHVLGTAADITIPALSFNDAKRLVEQIDFDGTGWYPPEYDGGAWFIHVDVRDGGIGSHIVWVG